MPQTAERATSDSRSPSLAQLASAFRADHEDIVFVSGSRLEGLGNEKSDYDVYVVQKDGRGGPPFVTIVLDGAYVVYETFNLGHFVRVADTLNAIRPDDFAAVWNVSWFDLECYYRVLIGSALSNASAFADLQCRFARPVIDACVETWCALRAVARFDEARRKAALGKTRGAYLSAQLAAWAALDSYLASQGQSYPSFKWRYEKLKRLCRETDPFFTRAWDLKALGSRTVESYLDDVAAWLDELNFQRFAGWSIGRVTPRKIDTVSLVRLDGAAYLVANKNALFELTPAGEQVWNWIDGRTDRATLTDRAAAASIMAGPELDRFLFELEERSLLK
jgi:hypothetical protein